MRRLAAIGSLVLFAAAFLASVLLVISHPGRLVITVALLALAAVALWYAITRSGVARKLATTLGIVALASILAAVVVADAGLSIGWRVGAIVGGALLGRYSIGHDVATLKRMRTEGKAVPAAAKGVLIMNPKSGGGKAETFHLEDECRRRGIEPIVLQRGDDLLALAHAALAGGADVIGMAGGDGSQALVASVAADAGVPMVVVPAGTRNHLALDLGIDRNDVVGALDAFDDAVERTVDLADMNGRVFVNNVSLGLYATIVESPEYRDSKRDTALSALPQLLGPGATPFDLRFSGPGGHPVNGAHVVQVSNGPYGTTMRTMTGRPRLDTGLLGITALVLPDDRSATRFLADLAVGHPERYDGYMSWSAPEFTIESSGPIAVGLDGETLTCEPPLEFHVRPGVLRLRLATSAIGLSPAARRPGWRGFLPLVWHHALGRRSPAA